MKILVLDNYDSFTYNLVQYLREICDEPMDVFRNDAISLEEVDAYDTIVLSPGPGIPSQAGIMPELIKRYAPSKSIFGVCLGQQAIGEAFGGQLLNLTKVYHGIATSIVVTDPSEVLFDELPNSFTVGRYHSWVVDRKGFPDELLVTSVDSEDTIMSLRHKTHHVKGVQFHPESILTDHGKEMLQNFLKEARQFQQRQQVPSVH
ncbi:MAG: aminodeoxychorismate/anthranilate synthase component II [Bacteroidota bacterium]